MKKMPRYGNPLFSIEIDINDFEKKSTLPHALLLIFRDKIAKKYEIDIKKLNWFDELAEQINLEGELRVSAPIIIEERLVPLCLKGNKTKGNRNIVSTLSFDQSVLITYYLRNNRKITKIIEISITDFQHLISVDENDRKIIEELRLDQLIHFKKGRIIYGLRSWEHMLRTDNPHIHRADSLISTEQTLRNTILLNLKNIGYFIRLQKIFNWKSIFVGHDVYAQSLFVDACISNGGVGARLHKVENADIISFPIDPNDTPAFDDRITETRMRQSLMCRIRNLEQNKIPEIHREFAIKLIEDRISKVNAFSHMNIDKKTYDSFHKWQKDLSLPIEEINNFSHPNKNFILYLHSFTDSSCHWGVDGVVNHYQYFLNAAKSISEIDKNIRIIIRPHPVSFTNYKRGEIAKFDRSLQFELIKDIKNVSDNIHISPPWISNNHLLHRPNTVIVTRWGNIGIESAYLNIPTIISPIAPYAKLIDPRLHVERITDLPSAIKHAIMICGLGDKNNSLIIEDLIRYVIASNLNENYKSISKSLTRFSVNDWWIFDSIADQRRVEQMNACYYEAERDIMGKILDFNDRGYKNSFLSASTIHTFLNRMGLK